MDRRTGHLRATSVGECGPIANGVVDILGLIDGRTGGRELMQDLRHLTGGIMPEALCRFAVS